MLTKREIDAAKPNGRDRFLWDEGDGAVKGFGCRIFPSGRRSFLIQYRTRQGGTRRHTIGAYGTWTVVEARRRAAKLLAEVDQGGDPSKAKAEDRVAITVRELCRRYIEAAETGLILGKDGRPKKSSTIYTDKGRVDRIIIPLLGDKLVRDLTGPDIKAFVADVTKGTKIKAVVKTKLRGKAVVEGGAGTAARTLGLLGGILTYAVEEGIRPDNPRQGVKRARHKTRRVRLSAEQYAALGNALARSEREGMPWQPIALIRLIALTGLRLGEAVGLRKPEYDKPGRALRLLDTKTDESLRPIGAPVCDLLDAAAKRAGEGDFLFPGVRGGEVYGGLPKAWLRVAALAGIEGVSLHGLRHAFASSCEDVRLSPPTISALLGHAAAGSVTAGYIHIIDSALIAAADKVERHILRLMTSEALADVVPLPVAQPA